MSKKNKRNSPVVGNINRQTRIFASDLHEEKQNICFSFKYIDQHSSVFTLKDQQMRYVFLIIERLKEYSSMPHTLLTSNPNDKSTRFHPIDWKATGCKEGFPVKRRDLWVEKSYQFSLGKSKGRIAGFLIDNVFYIVWVDPKHQIYPMKH